MNSPAIPANYSQSLLNLSPPDVSELSSHFSSVTTEPDVTGVSLTELRSANVPPPRFSLFKKKRKGDDSEAADDEAEDDPEATFSGVQDDIRTTPYHGSEKQVDRSAIVTPRSNFRPPDAVSNVPPPELALQPHQLSEEERLRRQLFDMQRINASFREYSAALSAVRDRQQSLIDKVDSTKHLLDRYVAILGQAEHSARLLLDPTWEGAEAEAERINEARAREEEEIRRAREEELKREEEFRRQEEEEQRKVVAAAAKRGAARGRGSTTARATSVRGGPTAARGPSVGRGTPPATGVGRTGGRGVASGISQRMARPPSVIRGSVPGGVGRGTRGG